MRTFFVACIALLSSASVNAVAVSRVESRAAGDNHIVHQFPNETWIENLAVRQNGQILVTLIAPPAPQLYQVDPFQTSAPAVLIDTVPGVTGLLGIAEIEQDVWYFLAGNFSVATFSTTPGTYSLWKIDLNAAKPVSSKITDIPEGIQLNGLAVLNKDAGLIVISDTGAGAEEGAVYTANVKTGTYSKTIDDPTMKASSTVPGIDGIKIRGGYLYFANPGQAIFCRVPINSADGTATGAVEVIAKNLLGDDFSFDANGDAYIGQNFENTIAKVTPDGVVSNFAGNLNSSLVAGATSTAFGRTANDQTVLYVTTVGGINGPVNGTFIEGGKVVAFQT